MYDTVHPNTQLAMLDAEAAHVQNVQDSIHMWGNAAKFLQDQALTLRNRATLLRDTVWKDSAGQAFTDEVYKSADRMNACAKVVTDSGITTKLTLLSMTRVIVREQVRGVCERYRKKCDEGKGTTAEYLAHCAEAGMHTAKLDSVYRTVADTLRSLQTAIPQWYGPQAAVDGAGGPYSPSAATTSGAGDPSAAGAGDPVAAEPQSVEDDPAAAPETADDPADLSDALNAATSALSAAEGLLGSGAQVPDPASLGDLGIEPVDYAPHANHAGYATGGQPTLAGLDAGGSFGGGGGGPGPVAGTSLGAGTVSGAGNAPMAGGIASTASGTPAVAGGTPPMYPPNNGAGAAGARRAAGGIKPGDSGRPVAENRPRARRAGRAMTPGVALAGRAGAGAPKPAARRGWDSDNDSLQVLDENLWQVDPQEEETHEDRRQPGSAVRDRAAAQGAGHAGLDGQGRRAYPGPGAR
jgi:hypothetical protein